MNQKVKLSIGLACIIIISGYMVFSVTSPGFNEWPGKEIASFFITEGWKELAATNTVTTIVWEFRGYDTLGEETILFTSAMGIFALGFGLFSVERISGMKQASGEAQEKPQEASK